MSSTDQIITVNIPQNAVYAPSGCIEGSVLVDWPASRVPFVARAIKLSIVRTDRMDVEFEKKDESLSVVFAPHKANSMLPLDAKEIQTKSISQTSLKSEVEQQQKLSQEHEMQILTSILFESTDEPKELSPDEHLEFPFELYLPNTLAPSFNTSKFFVFYELVASMEDVNGQQMSSPSVPITIVEFPSVQPKNVPLTLTWSAATSSECFIKLSSCCTPSNVFSSISFQSSYYLPGDTATAFCSVQNNTGKRVISFSIEFYKEVHLAYRATGGSIKLLFVNDTIFRYQHESIARENNADFVVEWKLPEEMELPVENATGVVESAPLIVKITYNLVVRFKLEGSKRSFQSPIFTIPIRYSE